MNVWIIVLVGVLTLCFSVHPSLAQQRVLNWNTYEQVRDYADRKATDKWYTKVPWRGTVLDGLIQGQKQDKPVLLWLYFGDARGHC